MDKVSVEQLLVTVKDAFDQMNAASMRDTLGGNVVASQSLTTDSEGTVLILFLENGQSLKLRAELFGKPKGERLGLMDKMRAGQRG